MTFELQYVDDIEDELTPRVKFHQQRLSRYDLPNINTLRRRIEILETDGFLDAATQLKKHLRRLTNK